MQKKPLNKLKIGLVLNLVPGYSETFFRNKIKGLQSQGFEVLLFVKRVDVTIDFPCKVIVAPEFGLSLLKAVSNGVATIFKILFLTPKRSLRLYRFDKIDNIPLKRRLKNLILNQFFLSYNLDWLHFGFGILAYRHENVAKAIGAKMAVSFRGYDLYLSPLKHIGCYDLLFKKDVKYHVLSKGMKQTLIDYCVPANSIHVITPAINTGFFKLQNSSVYKEDTVINILTIARLHWKKGLEYTLEALKILKQKGISFKYTIIGDGDQYERLIFATHQLGLSEHVNFIGKLSPTEVRQQLELSAIYLQYSIQEGFCNAVLEAQSMGLLCIVSNAEGLDENILDNITGWVVPKRKSELLAEKIIEVIQLKPIEKQRIILKASERVNQDFNLKIQNKAFNDFYRNLS
ncbi:glycosyltransferase family 4 protein [Psychroserpens burtonensis]|uniref:Glycosyltransferase family 4 protein n=1 Tax=Psychroserpens burtonensis TaxID=49278 RepID=A0A5C7B6Q3_9FLAO|nr:glycosyltransferase [Psychroserpens burtonensis]TXE17103.1 glycosyltransferase family 4 protein [Psychroserpens burtonensis]